MKPDNLFLGQKDYQQCLVIKKLITAYNIPTALHIVPTKREENGLAMSSRNLRLSAEAQQKASTMYKALNYIKSNFSRERVSELKLKASTMILKAGFEKIDYIEICDVNTLIPVSVNDGTKQIALVAAFIEQVRLIDNLLLN